MHHDAQKFTITGRPRSDDERARVPGPSSVCEVEVGSRLADPGEPDVSTNAVEPVGADCRAELGADVLDDPESSRS